MDLLQSPIFEKFPILKKLPIRLLLSVIAGIAVSLILSVITHEILHLCGVFPPLFKKNFDTRLVFISLAYHSVYAVIGAYVTAIYAKETMRKAILFLGSKSAIMWLLGAIFLWKHAPAWYNITKAILGVPLAMLGGQIYAWHTHKKHWFAKPDAASENKTIHNTGASPNSVVKS